MAHQTIVIVPIHKQLCKLNSDHFNQIIIEMSRMGKADPVGTPQNK
jgi:hypothetical protein